MNILPPLLSDAEPAQQARLRGSRCRLKGNRLWLLAGWLMLSVTLQAQDTQPWAGLADLEGVRADMTVDQMLELGKARLDTGRLDEARKILLEVVKAAPDDLRALSQLGFAYESSANTLRKNTTDPQAAPRADAFLQQAVDIYLQGAAAALRQNRTEVAEPMYNRVLLHQPGNPVALLGLARVNLAAGRRIQAVARYKDYLTTQVGGRDAQAHVELARAYLADQLWRQAADVLHSARPLDAANAEIDLELAQALQIGNRLDDAVTAIQAALQKQPGEPRYRRVLAELLLARGESEQAGIEARRTLDARRELAQKEQESITGWQALLDDYKLYVDCLRALLASAEGKTAVRLDLAKALVEQAELARQVGLMEALATLNAAPQAAADDAGLLLQKARILASLNRTEQAAATCQAILDKNPNNADARQLLDTLK